MTSITGAIAKVKDNPVHLLDKQSILGASRRAGHSWGSPRDHVADPGSAFTRVRCAG